MKDQPHPGTPDTPVPLHALMRLVQEAGTYLEQVRLAAQAGRLAPEKGQPLISGLQQALAAVQVPAPTHQGRTPDEV